ncbi:PAS domain-containing hybrid sensor histidine kinase/response regulator [Sphingomonas sp. PAMC 26605]|uniref:PAS domain-containing hybrid sensor histidine kinase/response regulator n=1 Tax=Sphingomonas sp. PAMC 26605 TaxID=1112214 RepID=UPI00026CD7F0|nr:PAS domain-containing protein [Sphingomonas sp. PAMC 26605]
MTLDNAAHVPFLRGGGEMGERVRQHDWTLTPLGDPSSWPLQMATLVAVLLEAGQPMFLAWGPERTLIYNNAYAPLLGGKHPGALGKPFLEVWSEVATDLIPLFDQVFAGDSVHMDDITLYLDRGKGLAEAHFAFSYTPIRNNSGTVVGLFCPCVETTEEVAASRRLATEQERHQAMLCQMPGFVAMLTGPNHVYEYVNDAYVTISGERDFLGRGVRDVFPELKGQGFYELLDQVYSTGERFSARALPISLAGEGKPRFIDLVYEPVRNDDRVITGIFVGGYDITERVAAEHALLASEASSAQVLDATSEAFYAVDRDGLTTLCNAAFLKMLDFEDRDAVIGRALHGVIHHTHPDGRHYAREDCPIYRAASTGVSAHILDELFFRADGTGFPVEYRAEPIILDGVLTGAICTFVDITERKAAQAALAASEAEFRTFAQAMLNHVWASSPDGMLNWFNQRVYDYSGIQVGALDGTGWTVMVHPEDTAAAGERWAASLSSGETYETEFRLRRADGKYRWHLARAIAIRDEAGEIVRWIGTNTDIHDQKGTAEQLASLNATLEQEVADRTADRDRMWRNSQDLLLVLDLDGTFRAVSPSVGATIGWSIDEMVGHSLFEFLLTEDEVKTREGMALLAKGVGRSSENRYRHRDGGFRWISWVATAEEGLIYATGRHITAEREAAIELASVQDALRQSQKMEAVGQLTGGIAHDFNNMLAVVIGSLDLLSRHIGDGDARSLRYVEAAAEGAKRAALLTQRLLAFSRQQRLQPERVDPNKLVAGMSDLLRHSLGADVRLETVLTEGQWRMHVDPNQLENVILNLAVNARDAMPEGGRLTIETQNAHLDERYAAAHLGVPVGQYVLIAVSDTGSGMPPEVIAKAFDPFFTTKEVGKGTGLGLSQVYGFVKQSGGHVKIYSEAGQGTAVKIYLPRLFGSSDEEVAPSSGRPVRVGDDREVILVVDDEAAVRQFSVDALLELGYGVIEADGAASALRLLEAHPEIVLLFTDVIMPDVNGRKLAEAARAMRPDLLILFTTGYTRNAVVHNGVLDEGVQLIGKPFSVDQLGEKIRAALDDP